MTYNSSNCKFAFDFHNVIVNEPFGKFRDLSKLLSWDIIPKFNMYLPFFIYYMIHNLIMYNFNFTNFNLICKTYDQMVLYDFIINTANNVIIDNKTVSIIRDLKNENYKIDLVSNIDIVLLKEFETNPKYSEIKDVLSLFDSKFVTGNNPNERNIRKNNGTYFSNYLTNNKDKYIIFIDDHSSNIRMAEKFGIKGIIFKSADKLRNHLISLKIM